MLKIFNNELDASEFEMREYDCLLSEWMQIREQYPQARLYKDVICIQNDITPKTREQAWVLKDKTGEYQILCHAGDPVTTLIVATVLAVGTAVYTYMNMPDVNVPDNAEVSGSPNNSLSNRQNKHRVNERVADIYGKVKALPDLISSVYRYYKDNIQIEECLLTIGTGYFYIDEKDIKESETPVSTIEGASVSIYEPGQSLLSDNPQIKIGTAFDKKPLVTKQVSSIDGRQRLIPPNSQYVSYFGSTIINNGFSVQSQQGYREDFRYFEDSFVKELFQRNANFTELFESGEEVIIRNTTVVDDADTIITSNVTVQANGQIHLQTSQNLADTNTYERIAISALLLTDSEQVNITNPDTTEPGHEVVSRSDTIDLAGNYLIESLEQVSDGYMLTLVEPEKVNINFSRLTKDYESQISAALTNKSRIINFDGTYTIASVTETTITLVNPSAVNDAWDHVDSLTSQQLNSLHDRIVQFAGSRDNYIGWYYAGNNLTTGFMLNFLAGNGIYEGDQAKQVAIEVEYQMVENGEPVGDIYKIGDVMQGVANNRNPVGLTIKQNLPATGQFRFRVKRANDNGNSANLIDDTVFESAYSFYETTKTVYEHDTIIRLQRMAIGSGTNASELNLIVQRKLQTPEGFLPTSNFADITKGMALDPYIGCMEPSEVDIESLYEVSDEIIEHFGTPKAAEFNYTFDDKYASYQEMIFTVAEAVCCTARRENGQHYFTFEKPTPNSLVLFNHRNIKPESMTVTEMFGIENNYDGLEFKWRDPDNNYAEAVIKLPDDLRTNYKTVESHGVTNKLQAHFLAHRLWNKLKYNRKGVEFTAYGEADLVTRMDRAAIVDSTVPILCSGEIELQENTILTLDYPAELDPDKDYVVHLQLKNGSVEVIDIVRQLNEGQIEIAHIPMMPLVTDGVAHAMYNITEASDIEEDAYLITEKKSHGVFESTVNAMSYDTRYYNRDYDYKNGLISA